MDAWTIPAGASMSVMLAAVSGFHPRVACRSSDYRFMSALVGAGVGVALIPGLALTGRPEVRDLQITPQPTRYVGAYLPKRHQPNPAAERLLAALRARASAKPATQPGPGLVTPTIEDH